MLTLQDKVLEIVRVICLKEWVWYDGVMEDIYKFVAAAFNPGKLLEWEREVNELFYKFLEDGLIEEMEDGTEL